MATFSPLYQPTFIVEQIAACERVVRRPPRRKPPSTGQRQTGQPERGAAAGQT